MIPKEATHKYLSAYLKKCESGYYSWDNGKWVFMPLVVIDFSRLEVL